MATKITVVMQNEGAVFPTAIDANADRFSGFPELLNEAISINAKMVQDGILAQNIERTWDQSSFTLTFVKLINDMEGYDQMWGPMEPQVRNAETENGWTQVSQTTEVV